MTLFIGIPCASGVVVSADSRVTYSDTKEAKDGELKIHVLDTVPPTALCLAGRYEIEGTNRFHGKAVVLDHLRQYPSCLLTEAMLERCGLDLARSFERHLKKVPHLWPQLMGSTIQVGLMQARADGSVAFGGSTLRPTQDQTFDVSIALLELRQGDPRDVWKVGALTLQRLASHHKECSDFLSSNLTIGEVDVARARHLSRATIGGASELSASIGGPIKTILLEHDKSTLLDE